MLFRSEFVIVDLYPFSQTVKDGGKEQEIIEKIDIGGISLIRAAAKNFNDVVIIPDKSFYADFLSIFKKNEAKTTLNERKRFAKEAFRISSHYDEQIFNWYSEGYFNDSENVLPLRYGENPHQKGSFHGNINALFEKLHGKELSYNNLLDVDAAMQLMYEFKDCEPTFAILKHNNACGIATRKTIESAYKDALAGDPISAFGGILIANRKISLDCSQQIHNLFFEVIIAPEYSKEALEVLKQKKNRIILIQKDFSPSNFNVRSILNGVLKQDRDNITEKAENLQSVTENKPNKNEIEDLIFANKLAKHTKSNTIVLAKNQQLLASGTGQTSRVDALRQAIQKAEAFNFDLKGCVMASDAFFPFPDCVEIAHNSGIESVIHPGGSIKDQLSIDFCNSVNMKMVISGTRHFKH